MKRFWAWIKSIGWLTTLGTAVVAVLFVLAGAKARKLERRAAKAEDRAQVILQDHTKVNLDKAKKLQDAAAGDKVAATQVKQKMREQLDKLGDSDENIDDIADRFNSRRKRVNGMHSDTSGDT